MKDIMRDELGAPKLVGRNTFQAELDVLRVREKAHSLRPSQAMANEQSHPLYTKCSGFDLFRPEPSFVD
jgi:hypothetical protein